MEISRRAIASELAKCCIAAERALRAESPAAAFNKNSQTMWNASRATSSSNSSARSLGAVQLAPSSATASVHTYTTRFAVGARHPVAALRLENNGFFRFDRVRERATRRNKKKKRERKAPRRSIGRGRLNWKYEIRRCVKSFPVYIYRLGCASYTTTTTTTTTTAATISTREASMFLSKCITLRCRWLDSMLFSEAHRYVSTIRTTCATAAACTASKGQKMIKSCTRTG
ncbi:unnamed protein product, partial [Trichogramma brassicae]